MADPLTRRQHSYVKRVIEALETTAEAVERIADRAEGSSKAGSDPDAEAEAQRVGVEQRGRYDELGITGVATGSVAIDHGTEPPELLVHANSVCVRDPADEEDPSHIIGLPGKKAETKSE